ncbi:hypothetical protein K432DRAFT_124854 [Lepidopterella palustris CBS 459.81]|uniref:Uncharacterized protein n=1 Tax=Lepidopterella palustris CBS 459.81 TaxID=1314670 RepID=A0A8E2JIX8_9PEZI|nr:hypothetical protein K432DRAFT_124854 [Lepidopterella palustris CBS 459.81]
MYRHLLGTRTGCSQVDVERVLGDAISGLKDLQEQVKRLLLFFHGIVNVVDIVIQHYQDDYTPRVQREEILVEAVKVKIHFATIQRISQAYIELSDKHIVGGFREIGELGLADSSITPESRKVKELQLKDYKARSSSSVRETSQRAQRELQTTLKVIVEGSAGGILIQRIYS